jgi:hypothetical protein
MRLLKKELQFCSCPLGEASMELLRALMRKQKKRTEGREDYESFDNQNNLFSSSCLLDSWIALSDG